MAVGFDEGQGAQVADSSGNGNHGTITGAQWEPNGRFGSALRFDGDDQVSIPDAPSLDPAQMTIEAWVRPERIDDWQTVLYKRAAADDDRPSYAMFAGSDLYQGVPHIHTFNDWVLNGPGPLQLQRWTHMAGTFDGTTWRLYLDGVQVDEGDGPALMNSPLPLLIGGNSAYPNESYEGLIDDVRIYDRPLSAEEVRRDRDTRVVALPTTSPRPVMALGLEEGTGGLAGDTSGNGNIGYVEGAEWTTDGRYGRGLLFDGDGDRVTVADHATIDSVSALTVEAWVKPRKNTEFETIVMKEGWNTWYSWALYGTGPVAATAGGFEPPNANLAKTSNVSGGTNRANGTATLPVSTWTHLAMVYGSGTLRLYVNGTQTGSIASAAPPASNGALRIGANTSFPGGETFNGVIDEIRVYDQALSAAQIAGDRDTKIRNAMLLEEPETEGEPGKPHDGVGSGALLDATVLPPAATPVPVAQPGATRPGAGMPGATKTKVAAKVKRTTKKAKSSTARRCAAVKKKTARGTTKRAASKRACARVKAKSRKAASKRSTKSASTRKR
ncbi:MAG TPA: LamG-like jellyroll fold domain-containing protein [Solirubrobacteraceae bacterium]|nr:LamG-like jellyroll fold domain-containing protein [Solirubrobacteraceae bacterium]